MIALKLVFSYKKWFALTLTSLDSLEAAEVVGGLVEDGAGGTDNVGLTVTVLVNDLKFRDTLGDNVR